MNLNAVRKCNKFAMIFIFFSFLCYFLNKVSLTSNHIRKYWILSSTELYLSIQRWAYPWRNVEEKQLKQKERKSRKSRARNGIPTACAELLDLPWGSWLIKHHVIDCNLLSLLPVRIFQSVGWGNVDIKGN